MKAYTAKSSAIRAAKAQFGAAWETKAEVAKTDAGWEVKEAQAPAAELPANVSLAQALIESGETIEDLKDDGHMTGAKAADAQANKSLMGWKLSTTEKPTKKVWAIASDMPGKSRKEVIEACIAAGIGAGTARTQYQAWFSAMKASGHTMERA